MAGDYGIYRGRKVMGDVAKELTSATTNHHTPCQLMGVNGGM